MQQSRFQLSSPRSRVKKPSARSAKPIIAFAVTSVFLFAACYFSVFITFDPLATNKVNQTSTVHNLSSVKESAVVNARREGPLVVPSPVKDSVVNTHREGILVKDAITNSTLLPSIPHTLFFTYKHNILETKEPKLFYDNIMHTVSEYRSLWKEPKAPIRFLEDKDCVDEIQRAEPRLVEHFEKGQVGSYKADICRVAALYNSGGYYFDIDLKVVQPVPLDETYTYKFVTVHESAAYMNFFQAFIASAPKHPILHKALGNMLEHYQGRKFSGNMGPSTLKAAYKAMSPQIQQEAWLLHELNLEHPRNPPNIYENVPRQVGDGCCCNFVVEDAKQKEVYFFSRIVGASSSCKAPVKS